MLELPEWAIDLAGKPRAADAASATPLADLDDPANVERAKHWLEHSAPQAIEGDGGNAATYEVACRVKDFGVSAPVAMDLLAGHWNETKALPNWDPDDLQRIVENAFRYGSSPPGISSAHADFEPVEIEKAEWQTAEKTKNARRLYYVDYPTAIARATEKRAEPLIKGLLDCKAMSVVYGESNSGKTFVVVDQALHIATGKSWNGRRTRHGLAVYIAAEGSDDIYARIHAWHRRHATDADAALFALVPCPVDLRTLEGDTKPLIALIAEIKARFRRPVDLVVVDTLSRALAGGDENSSVDMGLLVRNCDHIRESTRAHLMLIHHTGKDKARGARGHSLLRGATDTELEVADNTLSVTKQRSMRPASGIRFELDEITLGRDPDGDAITSCTVTLRTASEFEKLPLPATGRRMWEAFQVAAKDAAALAGASDWRATKISTDTWEAAFKDLQADASSKDVSARHVRRLRNSVVESGYVRQAGDDLWLSN